jgi:TPR repeat protein
VADPKTITADLAQLAPQSETSLVSPVTRDGPDGKPAADDKADTGGVIEDSPLPAKLAPDLEGNMMKRASILMDQNDIAGARLVLNYLANHGSAAAAFALAETYDAKTWAGRHVTGMTPDAELADEWYTRAAALGSDEAAVILLSKEKP